MSQPFINKLQPAPVGGGFAMEDYWVWCGSAIRGEDNRYHLFASRWPRALPFFDGYLTHSEIVRASADTPTGPYQFEEVILGARGEQYWDGQITHNPSVLRVQDKFLLFYIGATYAGAKPTPEEVHAGCPQAKQCYPTIRIGLATADSVKGPWHRPDRPVLEPRPGKWDNTVVTNPAPCARPDGSIMLHYRSNTPNGLRLGVTGAERWDAPYVRLRDDPVIQFEAGFVEDPFVWWAHDHFGMIAKDWTGQITGEQGAGIHATSPDGLDFELADPNKAYSRHIQWDDGSTVEQSHFERPQLLIEDGRPTHLFAATGDGEHGFHFTRSWNMVVPLNNGA